MKATEVEKGEEEDVHSDEEREGTESGEVRRNRTKERKIEKRKANSAFKCNKREETKERRGTGRERRMR